MHNVENIGFDFCMNEGISIADVLQSHLSRALIRTVIVSGRPPSHEIRKRVYQTIGIQTISRGRV